MNLWLISPPIQDFYDTAIRLQPIGLGLLKAIVEKNLPEVRVTVKDYHQGRGRRTIGLPLELAYLKKYYPYADQSPFCNFHHYYHFGAPFSEIAREVAAAGPDLVGISSLFTPYYREVLTLAREIKARAPIPIIVGGAHVSAAPTSVLADPHVDFIIRGEGERPLVEFLGRFLDGLDLSEVPNLGYKKKGRLILNPITRNYPLDDLPPADLTDLGPDRFLFEKKPLCFIVTSRGCPRRCRFCSVHLTFGHVYRRRRLELIMAEIRQRYLEGFRVFDFEDDHLSYDLHEFKKLMAMIAADFGPSQVKLTAMNGLAYDSLDLEALGLMTAAGFSHVNLSLVSSDPATLIDLGRSPDVRRFIQVVDWAHGLGLKVTAYQIIGLPNETIDRMADTLALLAELPVLIGASIFYLTPGCPLANDFPELGPADFVRARSTAMAWTNDGFDRDDLYTLFMAARILNFLKGLAPDKGEMSLDEALKAAGSRGKRDALGAEILTRFFAEGRLFAATPDGAQPLDLFKPELFFRVWGKIRSLTGQTGGKIETTP